MNDTKGLRCTEVRLSDGSTALVRTKGPLAQEERDALEEFARLLRSARESYDRPMLPSTE